MGERRLAPPGVGGGGERSEESAGAVQCLDARHAAPRAYQLPFAEVVTDNGPAFAAPTQPTTPPVEQLRLEGGLRSGLPGRLANINAAVGAVSGAPVWRTFRAMAAATRSAAWPRVASSRWT